MTFETLIEAFLDVYRKGCAEDDDLLSRHMAEQTRSLKITPLRRRLPAPHAAHLLRPHSLYGCPPDCDDPECQRQRSSLISSAGDEP